MNYMPQKERTQGKARGLNVKDGLSNQGTEGVQASSATPDQQGSSAPPANVVQENYATARQAAPRTVKKRYVIIGAIMLAVSIVGMVSMPQHPAPEKGEAATEALESGSSRTLKLGARLASSDDETSSEPKDYTVEGTANGDTTKLYVWDYAGEDGDYVQVIVDGEPISEEFMILHKPREFDIPTKGTVQVKGIHDAGGGLTYAAHYDLNGESYFNNAPEGVLNTYTVAGT